MKWVDLDQTHDEMIQRVNEEAARNEARIELALDSFDAEALCVSRKTPSTSGLQKSSSSLNSKWVSAAETECNQRI